MAKTGRGRWGSRTESEEIEYLRKRIEVITTNRNALFDDNKRLRDKNAKLKEEKESLEWFVLTLADIFNYNEYDIISPTDVTIWLNTVVNTDHFTKDEFRKIHAVIIKDGLVTLPTSDKAIKAMKGGD